MIKINLGGGQLWQEPGWTNLDRTLGYNVETQLLADYSGDTVDLIYSSHFLEHISFSTGLTVLKECYRILKKGGLMRIVVPDIDKLWLLLRGGDRTPLVTCSKYYRERPGQTLKQDAMELYGIIGKTGHKAFYSSTLLSSFLCFAGFETEQIYFMDFLITRVSEYQKPAIHDAVTGHVTGGFDSAEHVAISCYLESVK